MVGDFGLVKKIIKALRVPRMKIIPVTYSQSPIEQQKVYDIIHLICE
jgi:hypothetical protein